MRSTYRNSVPRHRFRQSVRECRRSFGGGFCKTVEGIEGGGERLRFSRVGVRRERVSRVSHRERGKKVKLKGFRQRGERGGGVDDVREVERKRLGRKLVDQVDVRELK